MKLLSNNELEWSSVVANNAMNRDRISNGINSYEGEVKLDPIAFLKSRRDHDRIQWTDLCCGSGRALIQAANELEHDPYRHKLKLIGVDLVDFFAPHEKKDFLVLKQENLDQWNSKTENDLITIVHGLHYLGDKMDLIRRAINVLKSDGLLIANLDLENIKIVGLNNSRSCLMNFFKKEGWDYNARSKLLKVTGDCSFSERFKYLGADDEAGPNYTGQEAVDSYYQLLS